MNGVECVGGTAEGRWVMAVVGVRVEVGGCLLLWLVGEGMGTFGGAGCLDPPS